MRHKVRQRLDRLNGHKLAAMFIVAIFLIGAAFYIRSRQTAAADLKLCRLQQRDRDVLRSILVLARSASRHSHTASPEQRREAEAFYAEVLGDKTHAGLVPPIDCKSLPSLVPLP